MVRYLGYVLLLLVTVAPHLGFAVPSFADQTGVPCAQCHVIAFGPALTEYGRQFKLNGYVWKRQDSHTSIPLSATVVAGFSQTDKDLPNRPTPDFSTNGNFVAQTTNAIFGGRLANEVGAFVKGTYDGVAKAASWGNLDVRWARSLQVGTHSLVAGVSVNNNPTVEDLWNSTPVWGFPYVASELVPTPAASTLIQGRLGQTVLGAGGYAMIDSRYYVQFGLYRGLSNKWLGNLGNPGASTFISGVIPYLRATYQQQLGQHYFEVGFSGMNVKKQPDAFTPGTDRFTDFGLDGTYQFAIGTEHAVDAHAQWIHEDRHLDATFAAGRSSAISNSLDTFLVDGTYTYRQTWVGAVGLFDTTGSTNRLLFPPGSVGGSASGSPSSRGYTLQVEYVPFGKAGSPLSPWVNLRVGLQYVGYTRFNGGDSNYDGSGRSAGDNNTLFLFLWVAI